MNATLKEQPMTPPVALAMGSKSDWKFLEETKITLDKLNIACDPLIISAHRTPHRLFQFANDLHTKDYRIIIAGAGGAAHLPGMLAALTTLPVIGIPIPSSHLNGIDSLLSICEMPAGVPVATMSIGRSGAINAALYAAAILATSDKVIHEALVNYKRNMAEAVPSTPHLTEGTL